MYQFEFRSKFNDFTYERSIPDNAVLYLRDPNTEELFQVKRLKYSHNVPQYSTWFISAGSFHGKGWIDNNGDELKEFYKCNEGYEDPDELIHDYDKWRDELKHHISKPITVKKMNNVLFKLRRIDDFMDTCIATRKYDYVCGLENCKFEYDKNKNILIINLDKNNIYR